MTIEARDEIRKNIKTGFNVANFVLIVTSFFYIGSWVGQIEEQNIQRHKETQELKKDVNNNNIRITKQYEDIRRMYVPRTELEGKLDMMITIMQEMKQDIKTLEKR